MSGRIRVCLAGATGWVGRGLSAEIAAAPDLTLAGAVARKAAGRPLGEVLGDPRIAVVTSGTVADALAAGADVFVDYTSAASVRAHVETAIDAGASVVVGSSGLSDEEYAAIDRRARERGVGVLAAGNFALTAVLLQRFAEIAARLVPQWEIIDYARASKPDAPSGTARELAARLAGVGRRSSPSRSNKRSARRKRAARRSVERRCIRCASQASCRRSRSCSACRTSACRSVTTRARGRGRTSRGRCSRSGASENSRGCGAASTR